MKGSIMKALVLLSMCVLLTACAERLKFYHEGNDVVQRHVIPGSWDEPGRVSERTCFEQEMVDSSFWGRKVCPSDIEKNAKLSVSRGTIQTASYRDLVTPAVIQGAFFMGGAAIIGTQVNSGLRHQAVSPASAAFPDARISTFNTFGQAPVGFVR